jgi:hypothetical protein
MRNAAILIAIVITLGFASDRALASGHGPVFGAATPTLGRGGWSLDQAWTIRIGDGADDEQMLKTMVGFGITEHLQISASVPLFMRETDVGPARMMRMMSSARDFDGLVAYRFQRHALGIGARRESTVLVGGTAPLEARRSGMRSNGSIEAGAATGYASRAHYVWVGAGLQHFLERAGDQLGETRLVSAVYGYRPAALRRDGMPDLRFFVEATGEDRAPMRVGNVDVGRGARTVFVGPTALFLRKASASKAGCCSRIPAKRERL